MPLLAPLHMGALHPVEQALTLLLAFGPFVVLGVVIAVRRRAEDAESAEAADGAGAAEPGAPAAQEAAEDRESGSLSG